MKLFTLFCMSGLSAAFTTCAAGTMLNEANSASDTLSQEICCKPVVPESCDEILCTGDTYNYLWGCGYHPDYDQPATLTEEVCCTPFTQTCNEYTLPTVVGMPALSFPCAGDDVTSTTGESRSATNPSQDVCCVDLEPSCYSISSVWSSVQGGYMTEQFACPDGTHLGVDSNVQPYLPGVVNATTCCLPDDPGSGLFSCFENLRDIECPAGQAVMTGEAQDAQGCCIDLGAPTCQTPNPEEGMFFISFQCPDGQVFDATAAAATDPDADTCCAPATCETVQFKVTCGNIHDAGYCLMFGLIPDTSKVDLFPYGGGGSGLGVVYSCCMLPLPGVDVASIVLEFVDALTDDEQATLKDLVCNVFAEENSLLLISLVCEVTQVTGRRLLDVSYEVKVKATATAAAAIDESALTAEDISAWETTVLNAVEEAGLSIADGDDDDDGGDDDGDDDDFSGVRSLSGSACVFAILAVLSFV